LIQECAGTFVADIDEIRPQYSVTQSGAVFQLSVVQSAGIPASSTIDQLDTTLTSADQSAQLASPWYSDQVLPFDVTLSGANEYGAMCAAKIFGLEILNDGMGISIDDAVTEMQAEPGVPVLPYTKPFAHARQAQAPFRIIPSAQARDQAQRSGPVLRLSSGLLPTLSLSRRRVSSSGHSVLPSTKTIAHAQAGKLPASRFALENAAPDAR
jgi:hypothetical protein